MTRHAGARFACTPRYHLWFGPGAEGQRCLCGAQVALISENPFPPEILAAWRAFLRAGGTGTISINANEGQQTTWDIKDHRRIARQSPGVLDSART